jgi:rhomboid-like protein
LQNETFVRHLKGRRGDEIKTNIRDYKLTPSEVFQSPTHIGEGTIIKTGLFAIGFTAVSFVGASIWEYEKIRTKAINALRSSNPMDWIRRHQNAVSERQKETNGVIQRLKRDVNRFWSQLTPGDRVWVPILTLNVIVFGLWRVPAMKSFMLKHFASNPAHQGLSLYSSMLLSTFSHYSLFHIFSNMYVLRSFSGAVNTLGYEQYIAMYLSAGILSSFTSYAFKVLTKSPGFSLGASGAIMAVLAYVCAQHPNSKLQIIFIPDFQFSAGSAIQCIMLFDLAGLIFRWRLFDHAAHLGGAAFGLFWSTYGKDKIWPQRESLIGLWHQYRGKPSK